MGPELWISEVSSAWIGPALGTTALSNYDVRVVALVEGGWFPSGVNVGGGSRFMRPVGGDQVEKMRNS